MALAGYSLEDITIKSEDGYIVIEGKKVEDDVEKIFHQKEIAKRQFISKFKMVKDVDDIEASIKDGILTIEFSSKEKSIKLIPIENKN